MALSAPSYVNHIETQSEVMELVEGNMVDVFDKSKTSAFVDLVPDSARTTYPHPNWYDTSFARQIAESAREVPDVYLLTVRSAIPVADAIRGYFDNLGKPVPPIGYIRANSTNATYDDEAHNIEEIARLWRCLDGRTRVHVVDQYVASGQTIAYASRLLYRAGATAVKGIKGLWYSDIPEASGIDLEAMTSRFKKQMHYIGTKACEKTANA